MIPDECPTQRKVRYTRQGAKRAMTRNPGRSTYKCCGHWHLTSWSASQAKAHGVTGWHSRS